MDHYECRLIASRLRGAGVRLDELLGVDSATILMWESGDVPIPAIHVRQLRWLLQADDNHRALEHAELPRCEWFESRQHQFLGIVSPSAEEATAFQSDVERHIADCDICRDNAAWRKEHLIQLGPFPHPGAAGAFLRVVSVIPAPLFPAALGAAILGGVVGVRAVIVAIVALIAGGPSAALTTAGAGLAAALASAVAGAVAGLAFPIIRPLVRNLGALGDYLTAIAVVLAFGAAIGVVATVLLDPDAGDGYWRFWLVYGTFLGLFVGYMHRRSQRG